MEVSKGSGLLLLRSPGLEEAFREYPAATALVLGPPQDRHEPGLVKVRALPAGSPPDQYAFRGEGRGYFCSRLIMGSSQPGADLTDMDRDLQQSAGVEPDYTVPPPECLWWMEGAFDPEDKDSWLWTLMLMQPGHVSKKHVLDAVEIQKKKKPHPMLSKVRLEKLHEGLSAQIMHLGPYGTCRSTIEEMYRLIAEQGFEPAGKHHEIYLSDPNRTAPEKLKTLMRNPVRKKRA